MAAAAAAFAIDREGEMRKRVNPIYDEDEELYADSSSSSKLPGDCYYDDFSRGRMDTIYESYEEFVDSSDERSNGASSTDCTTTTSSARVSADDSPTSLLRRSVRAWCDATGLPTTVLVETKERSFRLHKFPLTSRSGHLKRCLADQLHVKLGEDFPGGAEDFELIANFCYDATIRIDAANVAVLRCCAGYLEMTEEYGADNLFARTESYLSQVAFKSWIETLSVLRQCVKLSPTGEAFQMTTRGIESLAAAASRSLRLDRVLISSADDRSSMVKDMLELPIAFFDRLVNGLRKQGLDEKPISQLILEYIKRWVLDTDDETVTIENRLQLLEGTVTLLPLERFLVPIKPLMSLLGCALAWGASSECRLQLEARIVSELELVSLDDILMSRRLSNDSRAHTESMQRIVSEFMSQQEILLDGLEMLTQRELKNASSYSFLAVSAVIKVWDEYLAEIASDLELRPKKFQELAEVVPSNIRLSHDLLYRAIHVYLKCHSPLSQADRLAVCQGLNCQKLSQEVCMHAVQNELMPLRMIVQAMFVQQLQSRSGSEHEQSVSSVRAPDFERRLTRSPTQTFNRETKDDGLPLGVILQRDAAFREAAFLKDDFEATKARLKELEGELMRMKMSMDAGGGSHSSKLPFMDGKGRRKPAGNCMYQVWGAPASGIRFGQRIAKTFQKLGLGSLWKSKPSAAAQRDRSHAHMNSGLNEDDGGFCRWPGDERQQQVQFQVQELEAGTPLRASSFRKVEAESSGIRRHVRHHSYS